MQFVKYQAAGNDYLVYQAAEPFAFSPQDIVRICDRHRGLGSDGILVPLIGADKTLSVAIYNTDGSQAEKSGNGLRILCRYLWDQGVVTQAPFRVTTKGGVVDCQVLDQGTRVSIAMGRARFLTLAEPKVVIEGEALELHAVSMGNPHCVVLVAQPTQALARRLGPLIERLSAFPERTNVQFVRVLNRQQIEVQIWERGVGYTLSSGTSSCAAAAVAHQLGLVDAQVEVQMPGGVIAIELDSDYQVQMQGPVGKVGRYWLDDECLA